MRARRAMALAHALSADGTSPDLIRREQRRRLVRAGRPVPRAHQAPRLVGAAPARPAVHLPILGADALVCRAVLEPARRADADVFITCRLPVHATLGDAVVGAEVLGADRAAVGAGLAGAVVVPADRERRRRATAMRTCHDPGSRASQRPLRAERRATPPVRLELPLGALYQGGPLDQLQGVHDGLHLAAPDLL